MADAVEQEILATLLRINERLESLESLLRAQFEQRKEDQALRRRMFAALSMIVNDGTHDD